MGVVGTFCQICGIATQHDHYVPMDGMFGIYRGGSGHEVCAPLVDFGPEHAWLKEAVGIRLSERQTPEFVEGEIHDGRFEGGQPDGFVWDGRDERAALHKACWELAGRPGLWEGGPKFTEELKKYHEQLFEFGKLVDDGLGWMLVDPRLPEGSRNRERILALLR